MVHVCMLLHVGQLEVYTHQTHFELWVILISHKTGFNNVFESFCLICLSISNRLSSLMSIIISSDGEKFKHCLTNSEPILPPAPVTTTLLPLNVLLIESMFNFTSSLPNKSKMETSLK